MYYNQDVLCKLNFTRKLGATIYVLMRSSGLSCEKLAHLLGYSLRDMYRVIEGKVFLSPAELDKISKVFDKTKDELINYQSDMDVPELDYMKTFKNANALNKILDLMDEYVDLKEACK